MDRTSSPTVTPCSIKADIEAAKLAEKLEKIAEIRSSAEFKTQKVFISLIALFLAVMYIAAIFVFKYYGIKEIIAAIVLGISLSLVNLAGMVAVHYEHLITIMIYDIVTKTTFVTCNPIVCIQCMLLNRFIKQLDEIHKLRYKK